MEKPSIFVLHSASIIGSLVFPTQIEEEIICSTCLIKKQPQKYINVHYELDSWNGEDIFQGETVFMISERLKTALEENNIKGCLFEKVTVKKSPFFEFGENAGSDVLPNFWKLNIQEHCSGPEVWWKRIPCENCSLKKWSITPAGIDSIAIPFNKEPVPMRTVFYDSWKGMDIFYLEDPDVPIVTEKLATILKQYNGEINLLETKWIL